VLDADALTLPAPRGTLSAAILDTLRRPMHHVEGAPTADDDPLAGDDHTLALHVLHELHHRGFAGVDDGWEWEPSILAVRRHLERELMGRLAEEVSVPSDRADVAWALEQIAGGITSAPLWSWLAEHGTSVHLHELWALRAPERLRSGSGVLPGHCAVPTAPPDPLDVLDGGRLDLDRVPGWALAEANVAACLRLQRRWRGALAGFAAAREQIAAVSMPAAARALQRADLDEIDLRMEPLGPLPSRRRAAAMARTRSSLAGDVLLGGLAARWLHGAMTDRALSAWSAGRSALRPVSSLTFAA
jgi:hypothetical protein